MVLKRKKDLRNICKTLVRPGLVISGSVRDGEGPRGDGEPSVPLSTTMSVSSLAIPSLKNIPTAVGTTDVGVQTEFYK